MCEAMQWNHLPEPGGLYAQDPALLDAFEMVWTRRQRAEHQEAERKKRQQKRAKP